jgi:hypothetical protein
MQNVQLWAAVYPHQFDDGENYAETTAIWVVI